MQLVAIVRIHLLIIGWQWVHRWLGLLVVRTK